MDKQTMTIHHTKHHQGYIDNLNAALKGHDDLAKLSVEDLLGSISKVPKTIRQTVINNAGGHANHSFFWKVMCNKKTHPDLQFLTTVNAQFGSIDNLKDKFSAKALGVFGSGWAFLVLNKKGKLELTRQSFQNSPIMHGAAPILGIDLWEHAYYLKYQNRRADYIKAWWNVVDWQQVTRNWKIATL